MKTVKEIHITHIHVMAGEGIPDVTGYEYLDGRSSDSEYEFFKSHYEATCDFEYDPSLDFINEISNSEEYEKFIAAFFNSAEDLNACFWESYKDVLKDWKEWETQDRIDRKKRFPDEKYESDFPGLLFKKEII
jgi:hypothetical protein